MNKTKQFKQLIDWFVDNNLAKNSTAGFRTRLIIGVILSLFFLILCLYALWCLVIEELNLYGHAFFLSTLLIALGILLQQYLIKNTSLTANLFTFLFGLCLATATYLTGGIHSPAISILLIIPIIAIAMLGWRPAVTWFLLLSGYVLMLFLLDSQSIPAPQIAHSNNIDVIKIMLWFFTGGSIFIAFATYEAHSDNLHRILYSEKEEYAYLSNHDTLTGLSNRQFFDKVLCNLVHRGNTLDEAFTLLYIDLDNFKPINDQYGHHSGDVVLKAIGQRIKSLIRQNDFAARIGGDEFAIILSGVGEKSLADLVANKILNNLKAPVFIQSLVLEVSASGGVALFPLDADSAEELVKKADLAMYKAKQELKDVNSPAPDKDTPVMQTEALLNS